MRIKFDNLSEAFNDKHSVNVKYETRPMLMKEEEEEKEENCYHSPD